MSAWHSNHQATGKFSLRHCSTSARGVYHIIDLLEDGDEEEEEEDEP
jgi:hypothetical protein